MGERAEPSYRWAAWSHWSHLSLLAAVGVAGATIDPALWAAALPVEALALWILPDVPRFRTWADQAEAARIREAERAYYLEQLWGLTPLPERSLGARLRALFVAEEREDVDRRIVTRTLECENYLEMREIVARLREMVPLARTRVRERDVVMLESVINGYLRLLLACRPLARAANELEQSGLGAELASVHERLEGADASLRPMLLERRRLLEAQLARGPKLRATYELLRARADALPHQLRSLHAQLLAEPTAEVHGLLEDLIERNELLADPLAELATDTGVATLLKEEQVARPRPTRQGTTR